MRKSRTPAGFVPKPLRNRSQKNAETSLLEPLKTMKKQWNRAPATAKLQPPGKAQESCVGSASEKAEPQQVLCRSHCPTAARKMPKRRFWNPLKRKKYSAWTIRNRSQKSAKTLLLEPTKNKEKRLRKVASSKRCFWNLLKTKKKGCERLPQARHSAT